MTSPLRAKIEAITGNVACNRISVSDATKQLLSILEPHDEIEGKCCEKCYDASVLNYEERVAALMHTAHSPFWKSCCVNRYCSCHHLIDHLASGKSVEEFFESLLAD